MVVEMDCCAESQADSSVESRHRQKRENAVWMEQLKEYVRGSMQQQDTTTR